MNTLLPLYKGLPFIAELEEYLNTRGRGPHAFLLESSPWQGAHLSTRIMSELSDPAIYAKQDSIFIDSPAHKQISIETIFHLQERISKTPHHQAYLVLIPRSELLSEEAANTLLKSIEEPISPCIFILGTWNSSLPLATVRSRTTQYHSSLKCAAVSTFLENNLRPLYGEVFFQFISYFPEIGLQLCSLSHDLQKEWVEPCTTFLEKHIGLFKLDSVSPFELQKHASCLTEDDILINDYLPSIYETFFLTFEHTLGTILRGNQKSQYITFYKAIDQLKKDIFTYKNKKLALINFFQNSII